MTDSRTKDMTKDQLMSYIALRGLEVPEGTVKKRTVSDRIGTSSGKATKKAFGSLMGIAKWGANTLVTGIKVAMARDVNSLDDMCTHASLNGDESAMWVMDNDPSLVVEQRRAEVLREYVKRTGAPIEIMEGCEISPDVVSLLHKYGIAFDHVTVADPAVEAEELAALRAIVDTDLNNS